MNMPGIPDITGIEQKFLDLVRGFTPHSWFGSHDDGGPHFQQVVKMDTGVNLMRQRLWVSAVYIDAGVQHKLQMSQPIAEFGQEKAHTELEFDHVPITDKAVGFVVSEREGLFGARVLGTFKVAGSRFRFDGTVVG